MKRKLLITISLLITGAELFSQHIINEGMLHYSVSTRLEHPTMGSDPNPSLKEHQILFTSDFLRVNSIAGKSVFQKITSCTGTQSDIYANNGTSFYLVQSPRMGDFFEFGPLGKIAPTITYVEDTATFQGYMCKKAILESGLSEDEKRTMEVWYRPGYQVTAGCFNYYFQDLKGIPVIIRYREKSRMEAAGHRLTVTAEYKLLDMSLKSPGRAITAINNSKQYKLVKKGEELARLMEIGMSMYGPNRGTNAEGKSPAEGSMPSLEVNKINTNPFEIGTMLKDFSGEGLNGELITLERYKGKVLVINFWFAQCAPCIEEMPALNALKKSSNPQEVGFLSITFNTAEVVKRFLESKEFTFDKIVNAKELIKDMNIISFPITLVLDRKGVIQYVAAGNVLSFRELESQIQKAALD